MPTALVTLGRFPKALTLTRQLKLAGYRVVVAEPFAWHLTRLSNSIDLCLQVPAPNVDREAYLKALAAIICEQSVTLVLPVSEEIHHVIELRNYVGEAVVILGPDPELYATLADKLRFTQWLASIGVAAPRTVLASEPAAKTLLAWSDCVQKPRNGCSGMGVKRLDAGLVPAPAAAGDLYQEYVAGEQFSTLSFIREGHLLQSVVYKGRVFSGSVAVCFERVEPADAVHAWLAHIASHLTFTGFVAFDLIVDDDGQIWPIECNPRLTSGLHLMSADATSDILSAVSTQRQTSAYETQADSNAAGAQPQRQPNQPPNTSTQKAPVRGQWAYSTLTEAYGFLFKGNLREFARTLRLLIGSTDVVWSRQDPLPFLFMTPLALPILWPAIIRRMSLGKASQRDIASLWWQQADQSEQQIAANPELDNAP